MENKISIDNLNPFQVEILDELWKMTSKEEYLLWFALQDERVQRESYTLMNLLAYELMEEQLPKFKDIAETAIKQIMEKK